MHDTEHADDAGSRVVHRVHLRRTATVPPVANAGPHAERSVSTRRCSSFRKFESCLVRSTNVVTITTFSLLSGRFRCPVAYPIALPDAACVDVAVRFSCDSLPGVSLTVIRFGRPRVRLWISEALAGHCVEADHVKIWQAVGKLRRRHGLVMSGEPREPGYRVEDWRWEARRARSTLRGG